MWTCAELKNRAKSILSATYWNGIVALLIILGISLGIALALYIVIFLFILFGVFTSMNFTAGSMISSFNPWHFSMVLLPMLIVIYTISIAVSIFLMVPIEVGYKNFFLSNRSKRPDYGNIFFALKKGIYLKIVGSMLWMMLFGFLFGLPYYISNGAIQEIIKTALPFYAKTWLIIFFALILIAAVILLVYKSISYSMTPYILCDNPSIGYRRALKLSIAMTSGNVGHIFLLGLSFIGWFLLGLLGCGIGVLFVMPYINATFAELYAQLRDNALRSGKCSFVELNFAQPGPDFYNS